MNFIGDYIKGVLFFFKGLSLIRSNLELKRIAFWPFLINCCLYIAYIITAIGNYQLFVRLYHLVTPPFDKWYNIFYIPFGVVAVFIGILTMFFIFFLAANLISSVFNDKLAQKTLILQGFTFDQKKGGLKTNLHNGLAEILYTLKSELKRGVTFLAVLGILLLLSLLPGLGVLIYSVGGVVVGIFFLAFNFLDYTLCLEKLSFKAKRGIITTNPWLSAGFGTIVFLLLPIPIINIMIPPVAVVAAALIYAETKSGGQER